MESLTVRVVSKRKIVPGCPIIIDCFARIVSRTSSESGERCVALVLHVSGDCGRWTGVGGLRRGRLNKDCDHAKPSGDFTLSVFSFAEAFFCEFLVDVEFLMISNRDLRSGRARGARRRLRKQ